MRAAEKLLEMDGGNPGSSVAKDGVMGKINRCKVVLMDWNKTTFKLWKVQTKLLELSKRILKTLVKRRKELEERERDILQRQEIMWF